ncbi:hypothetical protein PBV87_08080 [Niameybacter massiliensis]|uniref:DUF4355 domain-containing protein n=1 Tax=Holtiella tumoricola TaxID=3018743 RepID=A0AA42J0R0_9FIRM|nr:hypothetical protein [Holtiella tumoricola]MDA3731433.1 hypothetical protein [Holtiella tumoricola]
MKLENLQGFNEEQLEMVKKLLQSETDRIRTEYSTKIKDLEQYKPKEKSQAEIDLENRLKVLEDKEREIANKERQSRLHAKLGEKGLSAELSKYLRFDDENFDTQVEEFASVMNKTLLDSSYKPSNHKSNKDAITKEQFSGMGYMERAKLQETNPTLYTKLSE